MFLSGKIRDCKQKSETLNMDFMLILKPCQSLMNLQESPSVTLAQRDKGTKSNSLTYSGGKA